LKVVTLLGKGVPGDAKGGRDVVDCRKVKGKRWACRRRWREGWAMKEDKIINPFDSGLHAVIFQQGDCGVSHITLNATCCSQSFNGHMLDVYTISPVDAEVFFVSWTDGRVTVGFGHVQ